MAHQFSKEDLDEDFEQFLKESLSDDSFGNELKKKSSVFEPIGQGRNKDMKKHSVPWWISEEEDYINEKHSTSGSFLKSQRVSHPIVEMDEEHAEGIQCQQTGGVSISLSQDSLETNDSVVASGPNNIFLGVGLDTLEEQEEKERFFANLEKGASSTIDYSKLNKELDSNDSAVLQAFLRNHPDVKQIEDASEDEYKNQDKSGEYSEDFEEVTDSNDGNKGEQAITSQANEEKTGMLAKVVLLDSQDSMLEAQKVNEQQDASGIEHRQVVITNEMNGTGNSCGQTNSEIEALHQAYRHIEQSLGDTDEQRIHAGKIQTAENSIKDSSQAKEDCPKNTSTTDSDLPTIEELMKTIRADSSFARGSDLEPASSVKAAHNITHEFGTPLPIKEHQNECSLEKQNTGNEHVQTPSKEACQGPDNIQHDTLRLNIFPKASISHQDSKTNQVQQPSTWNKESLNTMMNKQTVYKDTKNSDTLYKRKSSVRSSGYGKSSSLFKHFSTGNEKKTLKEGIKKPVLKTKSPPRQKAFSGTRIVQTTDDSASTKKNYFSAFEQSLANSLQQQAKEQDSGIPTHNVSLYSPSQSSGRELYLLRRVQEAEEELTASHDLIQHLKTTSLQKEKEMELNIGEELNKGTKWTHIWGKSPDEEMLKELQNQETLLQGYQQENERLYKQMKELQMSNKKTEENMFKENQRLMTELASLREQMDKNNLLSCGAQNSEPAKNPSFTDLILEIRAAKAVETNLLEERKRLKQDKQALEVDLGQMKKERDLARAQIASISDEKLYEIKTMEESYKEEIGRLQKRLQWYAENQELLDKDAVRLRGAKEEIDKLKLEVDKLRNETGNQSVQQKKRMKERAADAKRIQDLERQVKEMEGILKRRHPNSLPALIYAAATAASEGDGNASAKATTVDFLERRIKKLEAELEGKDDEAKKSLRSMEQQFQKIKLQYEKRVGELEQLLAYKVLNDPQKHQDKAALEQELCDITEVHQITINKYQAEIDSLRNQVAQLELQKSVTKDADLQSLEYQVDQAHAKAKLVRLNQELVAKNREIQDLTKTVERLQKERRIMLSDKDSASKTCKKEKLSGILKKDIGLNQRNTRNDAFFPGTLDDKIYQPNCFADSHISDVLHENTRLKKELEKLSLELSQQRLNSQTALGNFEHITQRTKEDSEEYISALKVSHQKELEKILCQHAMEHSTSKVAELNNKISTQEVLLKHLQQQVRDLQREKEALAISQKREEILQKEVTKLLEELREAKERQSPEMKCFVSLERKIKQMETRYEQREQELQQIIQQTQHFAEVEQIQEIEKWKKLALFKNQELEKFRIELDSILDVLRQLQKQGVIIPTGGSNVPESYWKF